jgi:hypothetical protein
MSQSSLSSRSMSSKIDIIFVKVVLQIYNLISSLNLVLGELKDDYKN